MDRTSIFGIDDVGSIPAGRTDKILVTKNRKQYKKTPFMWRLFTHIKPLFYKENVDNYVCIVYKRQF